MSIVCTRVYTDTDNRLVRIGFGRHKGTWFFRIDLWFAGWRWALT